MRRILLPILIVLGTTSPLSAQRDPRADRLVTAWIHAAGGPRIWDSVRDIRFTLTTLWFDSAGAEVRRRPRFVWIDKRTTPYRVRIERTEADGWYVQIWTGSSRAALDGRILPDTARAVREIEYVAGDLTYWIGLPWKLRDPGVNLSYLEEEGAAVVHVTFGAGVGLHDGDRFWYYWRDRSSPFPTEVHYIEQGKTDRQRVSFSDPLKVGPATVYARRTLKSAQGGPLRALVLSDVVVNRGIRDSVFRLP